MFGIGYVNRMIETCSRQKLAQALDSKVVRQTCEIIARLEEKLEKTTDEKEQKWAKQRIQEAKKTLPCITPMAYFRDNRRSVKNAIPSGLNMLDVDHIDDPEVASPQPSHIGREYINTLMETACHWSCVPQDIKDIMVLIHLTPSTHGLRFIFIQPQGMTIEQGQAWMAEKLGLKDYDGVTKDLSRCSFLVPRDYVYYINEEKLFADNANKDTNQQAAMPDVPEQIPVHKDQDETKAVQTTFPETFKRIPYSEIVKTVLFTAGYDDTPAEGERNNALYMVARNLRYLCDFNPAFVKSVLPDWGLPDSEVETTIQSAVKSVRRATMPEQLQTIVNNLTKVYETMEDKGYPAIWDWKVKPTGILADIVNQQPEYLRNAAYVSAMTCFGTLLSPLRGFGMNGEEVALNFQTCISAPQATGKGFMKKEERLICGPIRDEDMKQMKILNDIEDENKRNAGKDGYEPKKFEGAIRMLATNTSNRILLERMDKAHGLHLQITAPELDSITKAEKSGKWSEKNDIYRLAYDNDIWGQDYANENSYHALCPLYLNLLFSGTPASVGRFFNDIENGLITRFLFVDIPPNLGQKRPRIERGALRKREETYKKVSERLNNIYNLMQNISTDDGHLWMDTSQMVADVEQLYDEPQRKAYLGNQMDPSRDVARRRYADYAIKMMMIETYLNDGVYTEDIRDRVIGCINLCTEQLLAFWGDEINKSLEETSEKQDKFKKRSKKLDILDEMPDSFTINEYRKVLVENGGTSASANVYLKRLVDTHLIENISRGLYRKI